MSKELLKEKEVALSDGRIVKVRKPKLRDIRIHFSEPNLEERQIAIVGTLAQMTVDELDALDYDDFILLKDTAESFLSSTGAVA
ncbi:MULTISPECIES: phage tail assembly protein [Marinomonas]|jgi:hypothetical protein|uniref:Phage tail assembly protein n=2 Tax=Marinomonas TaxID=28253 RepID=F2K1Q8_MARM1|nr:MULTISPECIES: phage tail assembly protein [Marinomonas]ADZ93392.1 hypothetical protein Marme_4193 [Marinomonas mediterranea MMB-1]TDO97455.1 tail assembly chaperone E/41/14-like protein [Marinomonas balearica]WCN11280.1 hypothetical protein GV055_21270 [Marinomonas mediterranea]WCN15345.1 hypothetical protein GV054_21200 [Marinomonas mediterranea]WCN19386.1 hypothetical protein GV053_21230 [Marinomonas mediterranea MMB-1]